MESRDDTGVADAVDIMLSRRIPRSSDVSEPWSDYLSPVYRLDGILQQIAVIPSLISTQDYCRIKVLPTWLFTGKMCPGRTY